MGKIWSCCQCQLLMNALPTNTMFLKLITTSYSIVDSFFLPIFKFPLSSWPSSLSLNRFLQIGLMYKRPNDKVKGRVNVHCTSLCTSSVRHWPVWKAWKNPHWRKTCPQWSEAAAGWGCTWRCGQRRGLCGSWTRGIALKDSSCRQCPLNAGQEPPKQTVRWTGNEGKTWDTVD